MHAAQSGTNPVCFFLFNLKADKIQDLGVLCNRGSASYHPLLEGTFNQQKRVLEVTTGSTPKSDFHSYIKVQYRTSWLIINPVRGKHQLQLLIINQINSRCSPCPAFRTEQLFNPKTPKFHPILKQTDNLHFLIYLPWITCYILKKITTMSRET